MKDIRYFYCTYVQINYYLAVFLVTKLRGYLAVVILDIAGDKQSEGESEEFELDRVFLKV